MKTILVDCDGVLADLVGGVLEVVNRGRTRNLLTAADVTQWSIADSLGISDAWFDEILSTPGFVKGLRPFPCVYSTMRDMKRKHSVRVVTSPFDASPFWMYERVQWLRDHSIADKHQTIFASEKTLIRGDFLIDDHPHTVANWSRAWPQGIGLLWDAPYNQGVELPSNGRRVRTWAEVHEVCGT